MHKHKTQKNNYDAPQTQHKFTVIEHIIKEWNSYCTRIQLFLQHDFNTIKSDCLTGTLMPHSGHTWYRQYKHPASISKSFHRRINCRHCQLSGGLQVNGEKTAAVPWSLQENFLFLFTSLCCYWDKIQNYVQHTDRTYQKYYIGKEKTKNESWKEEKTSVHCNIITDLHLHASIIHIHRNVFVYRCLFVKDISTRQAILEGRARQIIRCP